MIQALNERQRKLEEEKNTLSLTDGASKAIIPSPSACAHSTFSRYPERSAIQPQPALSEEGQGELHSRRQPAPEGRPEPHQLHFEGERDSRRPCRYPEGTRFCSYPSLAVRSQAFP
jgi:hypothetical protein